MTITRIAVALGIVLTTEMAVAAPGPKTTPARAKPFTARAYCLSGKTKSGVPTRKGIIAADPRVLPLGSVVRIDSVTGRRQGTYVVADTGGAVKGRQVDIFMPSCRAAKVFGVRRVRVEVMRRGPAPESIVVTR